MDINISSLYEEVHELLEIRSQEDEQANPFKSKYNARKILEVMKSIISNEIDKEAFIAENDLTILQARMAAMYLQLGIIGIETEELSTGQEHLEKVLETLKKKELFPDSIIVILVCLNNLAILWAQRDEQEKAFNYLSQADNFYNQYKANNCPIPKSVAEIFDCQVSSSTGWEALEKHFTLTKYYLAQVLGKLGKSNESSYLLLATLQRQLTAGDYEQITWAVNAANLAKFFQNTKKFKLARRVQAAAWTVIQSPEAIPRQADGNFSLEELEEKYKESKAEICHIWGLYCLNLLQLSYDIHEGDFTIDADNLSSLYQEEERSLQNMDFSNLEISSIEEDVPHEVAKDYEEAKRLFMSGLRWLNDARNFFTLEDHAFTHTQISQEISTLYKLLAVFDSAPDRRSKMHKRRINLLTPLLEELNSQYYLQVCRQLDFELGETYSIMMDCKYDSIGNEKPNHQQAAKINHLVTESLKHFQNFLDSFNTDSNEKPTKFPTENERPILVAHFHKGRLFSKFIERSAQEKLDWVEKSLECYKILVNYCDENPDCASLMSQELPICKDMVELLPFKMQRIRAEI